MSRQKQQILLRTENIKLWYAANAVLDSWNSTACILVGKLQQKTEELDKLKEDYSLLEAELQRTKQMLAVHENHNNPSSRSVFFVKERKKYRRMIKERNENESRKQVTASKRGARIGSKGNSPAYLPNKSLEKEYKQTRCLRCGRTDTTPGDTFWKPVVEKTKCGDTICFQEKITPAVCECGAISNPATESIPGSSAGPRLRQIIINIHEVCPSNGGIRRLLLSNHNITVSTGAISNCLMAVSNQLRDGSLWTETAPNSKPLPSDSRPAVNAPDMAEPYSSPWSDGTLRSVECLPPVQVQINEEISMAPYVEVDESLINVAGERSQELVLRSRNAILVRIAPRKTKRAVAEAFWMALTRPLLADMYRGGCAFVGPFQTCIVHVWRKAEALAIRHGVGSPEDTYCMMLLDIYNDAKAAAERITEIAGGPLRSACEVGVAIKTVPGLADVVDSTRAGLVGRTTQLAEAYRHGQVTDEKNRTFAHTLENALPYMFEFIDHPGMPGNTNSVERTIRGYVVRPRNIHRILPDWRAARTLETLQTLHATCALRGTFSGDVVKERCGYWTLGSNKPPPMPIMQ